MAWSHLRQIKGLLVRTSLSAVSNFEGREGNRFLCTHSHSYVSNLARRVHDADETIDDVAPLKQHVVGKPNKEVIVGTGEGGRLKHGLWHTFRSFAEVFRFTRLGVDEEVKPIIDSFTKFKDVKGVDEVKEKLEEIVHYLRDSNGKKLSKGVLLIVPPGIERTMLARAIAGEAGVPFFSCSGSEFRDMFIGVGARRIRDIFAAAKKRPPCIIFIDEIDAIGGGCRNMMTLNRLLVELDGLEQNKGIIVIGATNFPHWSLANALMRHGRFNYFVVVHNPDLEGRRLILESHMPKVLKADDVDLMIIARKTPGFSEADLAKLVDFAAQKATIDGAKAVSMTHLEYAKDNIYFDRKWA